LHSTGFISKNLGQFDSYIGSGAFLLGYELKKTDLQRIITMAAAKAKINYAVNHNGGCKSL
jgi:hypothetical protein